MRFDVLNHSLESWRTRDFESSRISQNRLLSPEGAASLERLLANGGYFHTHLLPDIERHSDLNNGNARIIRIGSSREITLSRNFENGATVLEEKVLATSGEVPHSDLAYLVTTYSLLPHNNETYRLSGGTFHIHTESKNVAKCNIDQDKDDTNIRDFQYRELSSDCELSATKIEELLRLCEGNALKQAS